MKKTINISISGIVFHVEEDGYELLYNYLQNIKNYFSTYEGSAEIIEDIENRIAEIFLEKTSETKQSITIDDVKALMASMGTIADFKEIEEDNQSVKNDAYKADNKESVEDNAEPKRLFRDTKRKLLGGVLSGLAYYFKIDAFWIRLLFVVLFFGLIPFSIGISTGFLFVAYVIMWISMPKSDNLPEVNTKKLMRNPDGKVLGGVANGIASYFGVDVTIIRLLFVVMLFAFGTGIMAYIIIWFITPEAKTLTEKMQLKGDPITIINIENNIKNQLNIKDNNGEESVLAKLLLFPFRVLASIFNFLSIAFYPVIKFTFSIVRVFSGLFIMFLALVFIVVFTIVFAVTLGWISNPGNILFFNYPVDYVTYGMPTIAIVSGYLAIIIPSIILLIASLSLLVNKFLMRAIVGWTFFGIWLVAIIGLGIGAANITSLFKEKGVVKIANSVSIPKDKTLVINIQSVLKPVFSDTNLVFNIDNTTFKVIESKDSIIKITQKFTARGKNVEDAEQNAKLLNHSYSISDTVITLDSRAVFGERAIYRAQNLVVEIAIPVGTKVFFDESYYRVSSDADVLGENDEDDLPGNLFIMETGGLNCISCANNSTVKVAGFRIKTTTTDDEETAGEEGKKRYNVSKFTEIEASSPLDIKIIPSDVFEVIAFGDNEALKKLNVSTDDGVLKIDRKKFNLGKDKEIRLEIKMPKLSKLTLAGATKVKTGFFDSENSIELDIVGASSLKLKGNFNKIEANVVGASKLTLDGKAEVLKAEIIGASSLEASDFKADKIKLECTGASNAIVNCVNSDCKLEAIGASNISYIGKPDKIDADISSTISEK